MNTNYMNAALQRYFQLTCSSCTAGSRPWEPTTERPAPHAPWHRGNNTSIFLSKKTKHKNGPHAPWQRGNYPSLFLYIKKKKCVTCSKLHGTVVDFLSKKGTKYFPFKKIKPKCIEAPETTIFMFIFIFIMMFRRGRRRTRCRPPPWRRSSWPTSSVQDGSNLRSCRWWEIELEIAWDSQFGRCDDMW